MIRSRFRFSLEHNCKSFCDRIEKNCLFLILYTDGFCGIGASSLVLSVAEVGGGFKGSVAGIVELSAGEVAAGFWL